MTHRNVLDPQHSVYINPPTAVCFGKTRDEGTGGNASALVATLSARGTDDQSDRFTEQRLVPANRLRPGSNTFMVCARNPSGELTGDIDEITILRQSRRLRDVNRSKRLLLLFLSHPRWLHGQTRSPPRGRLFFCLNNSSCSSRRSSASCAWM